MVKKVHIFLVIVGLLFTLIPTSLTICSMAAAQTSIPPGCSSEVIHVKFLEGTKVVPPEAALPPDLLNSVNSITRLFCLSEDELDKIKAMGEKGRGKTLPNLNLWFQIILGPGTDAAGFIENLKLISSVEVAEHAPLPCPPPAITPDFTGNQGYLDAATEGIDANYSWTISGGNGSGIKIYDVEYSWNQQHEDLSKTSGIDLLLDTGDLAIDPFSDNNHGTAVLGELIADNDTKGVTGISWSADIGLAPANTANLGYNPANAILLAVADGSPGDIILIEQQMNVCGLTFGSFGPSEWVSSVFDAIQTAVANRFVVVEAAGNGAVDLDQAACGTVFDRSVRDSGAIIVGAGQPPKSLDREREGFSSFGSRVDLQGWGSSVMTTGYGSHYTNPDDPSNPDFWYSATFSGTSSASPIVAGAAANLQGIALNQFGTPLTAFQVRQLLVENGSPQLGDTTKNIGPRPNLQQAITPIAEAIVNDRVTFSPIKSTFSATADTTGCPDGFVGMFSFNARLKNTSGSPLHNLVVKVATLTNGNLLQNSDGGLGGEGAELTVQETGDYSDGILSPGENTDVHFVLCLKKFATFTFFVDVFGGVE